MIIWRRFQLIKIAKINNKETNQFLILIDDFFEILLLPQFLFTYLCYSKKWFLLFLIHNFCVFKMISLPKCVDNITNFRRFTICFPFLKMKMLIKVFWCESAVDKIGTSITRLLKAASHVSELVNKKNEIF